MVEFRFSPLPKTQIKNIIFDLGGVLFEVNYHLTINRFKEMGVPQFDVHYSQMNQMHLFDRFERGEIPPTEFRKEINQIAGTSFSAKEIDEAWNAMLLGFPEENLRFLEKAGKYFRTFLLSNTNLIHIEKFYEMIRRENGLEHIDCYFDNIYLSHEIGARKPEARAYEIILEENQLNPSETLFIDDSPQHVEGASDTGIHAIWLKPGLNVGDLFMFS